MQGPLLHPRRRSRLGLTYADIIAALNALPAGPSLDAGAAALDLIVHLREELEGCAGLVNMIVTASYTPMPASAILNPGLKRTFAAAVERAQRLLDDTKPPWPDGGP